MKFTRLTESFTEELITEDVVNDYRRFANITEDVQLTEDTLDEWALVETACKYNIQPYDLKHRLLGEDISIDQAGRELEAEIQSAENKGQIQKTLDRSLRIAKRKQRGGDEGDYPNVLLISDAGALGGILARDASDSRYANRLGTREFASLDRPNSVLFLDEYNRAKSEIRGALLTLVQDHVVWDPTQEGEMRHLDNFLFTIAAINPPNAAYKGAKEMDPAERSRFYNLSVIPDPMEHLAYLKKVYTKEIEAAEDPEEKLEFQGKLKLATTILSSPRFKYDSSVDIENNMDTPNYNPLNYRSFKLALDYCDGTKEDLLSIWNHYCNSEKKRTIEDILHNYVDVEDEANAALKDHETQSSVFNTKEKPSERLRRMFDLDDIEWITTLRNV